MNLLRFAHVYNGAQMVMLTAGVRSFRPARAPRDVGQIEWRDPAPRMGNDCGMCGQPHSSHCSDCGKCPPGHYTWCEA